MWLFVFILTSLGLYLIIVGYLAVYNQGFDSRSRRYGKLQGVKAERMGIAYIGLGTFNIVLAFLVPMTGQVECFFSLWAITLLVFWSGIYSFWSKEKSRLSQ